MLDYLFPRYKTTICNRLALCNKQSTQQKSCWTHHSPSPGRMGLYSQKAKLELLLLACFFAFPLRCLSQWGSSHRESSHRVVFRWEPSPLGGIPSGAFCQLPVGRHPMGSLPIQRLHRGIPNSQLCLMVFMLLIKHEVETKSVELLSWSSAEPFQHTFLQAWQCSHAQANWHNPACRHQV